VAAVEVTHLVVRDAANGRPLLAVPHLSVETGSTLVVLGRTGAGKSLLATAIAGEHRAGTVVTGGILVGGSSPVSARAGPFLVPQDGSAALDPTMRIGAQIAEAIRWRGRAGGDLLSLARAVELTPDDLAKYPHELSGGMIQRTLIAMALAVDTPVIIVDEPTTGLDPVRSAAVVDLLRTLVRPDGALAVVSHDLVLARRLATHVAVIDDGAVAEHGPVERVLSAPQAEATRQLLAADPTRWTERAGGAAFANRRLALEGLSVSRSGTRLFADVDLDVHAGEVVGLCGPSGIGKTTLGDAALGLVPADEGTVRWQGVAPSTREGRLLRPRFLKLGQSPAASFPPRLSLGTVFQRLSPARHPLYKGLDGRRRLFERLSLDDAMLTRRPQELSGGELQRLALARAVLAHPLFLVCDEPSSQLDYVVQADVLDLVAEISREDGVAVLLISHDPSILRRYAHRSFRLAGSGRLMRLPEGVAAPAPASARERA